MSITLAVENDTIKLPAGVHVPDGTKVHVTLPEKPMEKKGGKWMLEFAGSIDGLPEDFAAEHDHYIHGTPKRAVR
jgi:hypothetical protein